MTSSFLLRSFIAMVVSLSSACVSPPLPEDFLDVGFRSPEQAFRSFQTAMAGKQLDLEYRCLGREFRDQNQIDGLTYRLGREKLFAKNPFIKWVAQAEITASQRTAPAQHVLTVRVKNWFTNQQFQVQLVREDFFEAWNEERSAFFNFDSFEEHVFTDEDDAALLYAVAQIPPDADPKQITEINFGREWRIAGFSPLTEQPAPSP